MPDETSPRFPGISASHPREKPGDRDWIFKPVHPRTASKTWSDLDVDVESARRATLSRGRSPGPTRLYHAEGRFRDELGDRFDYVFPELLEDPALPPWVFERVPFLLRGTNDRFEPRRAARETDRIVVGLRYGHGDLPRSTDRG